MKRMKDQACCTMGFLVMQLIHRTQVSGTSGKYHIILLMEEFLHHFIGSSSHYLQGFKKHIPGGCLGFLPSTVSSSNYSQ